VGQFKGARLLCGYGLVLQMELRGSLSSVVVGEYVFRITGLGSKLANILLSAKDDCEFRVIVNTDSGGSIQGPVSDSDA
jgi:hypothetical protein